MNIQCVRVLWRAVAPETGLPVSSKSDDKHVNPSRISLAVDCQERCSNEICSQSDGTVAGEEPETDSFLLICLNRVYFRFAWLSEVWLFFAALFFFAPYRSDLI